MNSIELAKRAVACKHWRWMPGMLAVSTNHYHRPARVESLEGETYGLTVIPDSDGPVFAAHHEYGIAGTFPRGCTVPDLTDHATLGCLLHLVREAWGNPGAYCVRKKDDWWVEWIDPKLRTLPCAQTEGAALVAALEAAP